MVQNLPRPKNRTKRLSTSEITNDETAVFIRTSDNSTSVPAMTTNIPSYQDYFSKIDQQIRASKQSLQSFDIEKQYPKYENAH